MNDWTNKIYTLAILSGKGGAGKTAIGLSMAKLLSEIGYRVLFIDCDIATHGATYFFESELENKIKSTASIQEIIFSQSNITKNPINSNLGFDFIPSTLDPQKIYSRELLPNTELVSSKLNQFFGSIKDSYQIILFDCAAGYSELNNFFIRNAKKVLFILEADPISTAALRVLFLQTANFLKENKCFQLFNKLSEDERKIYEKSLVGGFFTNLPPIPFDWYVRSSFSLKEIPSATYIESAFGPAIFRVLKIIFKDFLNDIEKYEFDKIGNWYLNIQEKIERLENSKSNINHIEKKSLRMIWVLITSFISTMLFVSAMQFFNTKIISQREIFGTFLLVTGILTPLLSIILSKVIAKKNSIKENIIKLDREMERYKTLLATTPQLREYSIANSPNKTATIKFSFNTFKNEDFSHKNFINKNFQGSNLRECDFKFSNLSSANLSFTNLEGVNFSYANLEGADLSNANLRGANLQNANLANADLTNANLIEADLNSAYLEKTDLNNTNFKNAKIASAKFISPKNFKKSQLDNTEGLLLATIDLHLRF